MPQIIREGNGTFGTFRILELSTDLVPHSHPEAQFVIALDSLVNDMTKVGDRQLPLDFENAVFANPMEKHSHNVRSRGGRILVFYIHESWLIDMFGQSRDTQAYLEGKVPVSKTMRNLIDRFLDSMDIDISVRETSLWLEKMADQLQKHSRVDNNEEPLSTNSNALKKIEQANQYMNQNLMVHRDVNILASEIGVSRSQLFRLFRNQFRTTPNIYWNTLRMEYAQKQLWDNAATISEIADVLGFSDPANFSRFFKDHTGFNASEYRSVINEASLLDN